MQIPNVCSTANLVCTSPASALSNRFDFKVQLVWCAFTVKRFFEMAFAQVRLPTGKWERQAHNYETYKSEDHQSKNVRVWRTLQRAHRLTELSRQIHPVPNIKSVQRNPLNGCITYDDSDQLQDNTWIYWICLDCQSSSPGEQLSIDEKLVKIMHLIRLMVLD